MNVYEKHPNYVNSGATGYPNDVAVLGFTARTYNTNFRNIAMALINDGNYAGVSCVITGWGRTSASK